jgi:hypothetical protein
LSVQASETSIAADGSNKLVTGRGLRGRVTTLVQPRLEIRVGPGLVEPVTGVGSVLRGLVGDRLVVLAGSLEERVTVAGLGNRKAVLISKGLELRVGPTRV